MGYTTEFQGVLTLTPALKMEQYAKLCALESDEFSSANELKEAKVKAPVGYCQWIPTKDGKGLEWNGGEKFYEYTEWLEYICSALDAWGVKANGTITWKGEDRNDIGTITVTDNKVVAEKDDIVPKGTSKLDVAVKSLEKIAKMDARDVEADDVIAIAVAAVKAIKAMK